MTGVTRIYEGRKRSVTEMLPHLKWPALLFTNLIHFCRCSFPTHSLPSSWPSLSIKSTIVMVRYLDTILREELREGPEGPVPVVLHHLVVARLVKAQGRVA